MNKIKKITARAVWLAVISLLTFACSDNLDINQRYGFDVEIMPVQKKIAQGETAEIRCRLVREGNYNRTEYYLRYFQSDGRGELRLDDGTVFKPNDLYPLNSEVFRLYYTSKCSDQQSIDIYIVDSFGQVIKKSFSFQNEGIKDQ